jgi:uncharacterized membrane protein YbhN (UPF0104 family)
LTDVPSPDGPAPVEGAPWRRTLGRRAFLTIIVVATLVYLAWLIVTNRNDLDRAILRFQRAELDWLVAAIVLEVAAQAMGGLVQRRLLASAGTTLGVPTAFGLMLAQNAIALSVPAGPVLATTFGFRQLRRRGADASVVSWVLAATNAVTGIAVGVCVLFALGGLDEATSVALVLFAFALALLIVAVEQPERLRRPGLRVVAMIQRLRRRPVSDAPAIVDTWIAQLGVVRVGRIGWTATGTYALASTAFDLLAFYCCVHAVTRLPVRCLQLGLTHAEAARCATLGGPANSTVLLAYAAGQGASTFPLLPGGIGLVESAMTATLTASGMQLVPALSIVLLYRFISYWGVIAIGGICWAVLRREHPRWRSLLRRR